MKKRVKLLTTIASLCLAVALMAFGVYAATEASLGFSSQVSFTSKNVDVTYTVQVDWTTNVNRTPADGGDVDGATIIATQWLKSERHLANATTASSDWALGTYEFDGEKAKVAAEGVTADSITFTIKIKNNSDVPYDIALSDGVLPVATTSETEKAVKIEVTNAFSDGVIAANTEEALVITYTMVDAAQTFTTSTFDITYTVTKPTT